MLTSEIRPLQSTQLSQGYGQCPPVNTTGTIYTPLAKGLGVLFVIAGLLKLFSSTAPETTGITSLVPSWSLAWIPVFELALGAWLVCGVMQFGSWITLLVTLGIFILHNLQLVTAGRSSCGCLGVVTVPPYFMLIADVAVLILFLKRRPGWSGWPDVTPGVRRFGLVVAVVFAVLGAAIIGIYAQYGAISVALADSRGEPLALVGREFELGTLDPGEVAERYLEIVNLTDKPVQIAMAESNCNCASFPELPIAIPANARIKMPIRVRVSDDSGPFQRNALFRSTAGTLRFRINGWVRQTNATPTEPEPSP